MENCSVILSTDAGDRSQNILANFYIL